MKRKIPICFVFLVSLLFLVSVSFALVPQAMEQNEQNERMPNHHFAGILLFEASINELTTQPSTITDTNALSASPIIRIATNNPATNNAKTCLKPEGKKIIKLL